MSLLGEEYQEYDTDQLIQTALKKVGGKSEKDICKYLPAETEGYIHHFTLRKIKKINPEKLRDLINEFIINAPAPQAIDPKPRARRNKTMALNQADLTLILKLAQKTGDEHLLSKLGAKISLPKIKRDLINSIKDDRVEEELWCSFVQAIESSAAESMDI